LLIRTPAAVYLTKDGHKLSLAAGKSWSEFVGPRERAIQGELVE